MLFGVAAQLLLKAGTNAVGRFAFSLDNAVPVGLQLALEPRILAARLLRAEPCAVGDGAVAHRGERDVPDGVDRLRLNALLAWWLLGEGSACSASPASRDHGGVVLVARS